MTELPYENAPAAPAYHRPPRMPAFPRVGGRIGAVAKAMSVGVPKWYDAAMEAAMIELTEQQVEALEHAEATPPHVVNPRTRETYVLLRVDEYERLKEDEYDDSPWTREELQTL